MFTVSYRSWALVQYNSFFTTKSPWAMPLRFSPRWLDANFLHWSLDSAVVILRQATSFRALTFNFDRHT
jgi:hypothetical protein